MARYTHEVVVMDLETLSSVVISHTFVPTVREGIDTVKGTMTLVLPIVASVP